MASPVLISTSEYPPHVSTKPGESGLLAEIVALTLQHMGEEAVFVFQPWKRGQAEVKAGRAWATLPYVKTPERERDFLFSDRPLYLNRIVLMYRRERFPEGLQWESLEDLRAYTLGGVRGYWYEEELARAGLHVDYTNSVEASIAKLARGRIDLFPINEPVAWHTIRELYPDEAHRFAALARPYDTVPSYLMVSRTYPGTERLLARFNRVFAELSDRGAFEPIIARYLTAQP